MLATSLVSRQRSEFGTSQTCRFCHVRAELKQSLGLKSACKKPPNGFKRAPSPAASQACDSQTSTRKLLWQLAALQSASQPQATSTASELLTAHSSPFQTPHNPLLSLLSHYRFTSRLQAHKSLPKAKKIASELSSIASKRLVGHKPLSGPSLWGGCCQLLFRGGYRPGFETWLRIRYFDGYSILRLRDGSSSDLRGSKKLAKAL